MRYWNRRTTTTQRYHPFFLSLSGEGNPKENGTQKRKHQTLGPTVKQSRPEEVLMKVPKALQTEIKDQTHKGMA